MIQLTNQRHRLLLFLALSATAVYALPTPTSLPDGLNFIIRSSGTTIADEIKCYSLPYGGIGIVSHLFTYWTVYWLGHCRKPYFPFSRLSKTTFDVAVAFIQIFITVTIAAITMVRCRQRWQFVLIALWKLIMSLVVGVWSFSSARRAKNNMHSDTRHIYSRPTAEVSNTFMWLYFISAGIGLVGLISLVKENFDNIIVEAATLLFVACIAFGVIAAVVLTMVFRVFGCCGYEEEGCFGFFALSFCELCWGTAVCMVAYGAFYSDIVLGGLADDLLGSPTGKARALYWVGWSFPLIADC
jgi:hypothetical protein